MTTVKQIQEIEDKITALKNNPEYVRLLKSNKTGPSAIRFQEYTAKIGNLERQYNKMIATNPIYRKRLAMQKRVIEENPLSNKLHIKPIFRSALTPPSNTPSKDNISVGPDVTKIKPATTTPVTPPPKITKFKKAVVAPGMSKQVKTNDTNE